MGIFDNKDKTTSAKTGASVIAFGVSVKGELNSNEKLFIDGEFEGVIHSSSVITIGPSGRVRGDIFASLLIVGGDFQGKIDCEGCEILNGGHIKGEIISDSLVIENGGRFEGVNTLKEHANQPAPSTATQA